jgi:cytochrome bd-type quinol oxidase subunit 2
MKYSLRSLMIGTTAFEDAVYRFVDDGGWPLLISLSVVGIVGSAAEAIWYYRRRKKQESIVCVVVAVATILMLFVEVAAMIFPTLLESLP